MTLSMAYCIGRASCPNAPTGGRGMCAKCYARHAYHGTLKNFPTMRERTAQLRAAGELKHIEVLQQSTQQGRKVASITAWRQRKYAERVPLEGRLIAPTGAHGRLYAYISLGCRGSMCYAAWRHYRITGERALPGAFAVEFGPEDCATYCSDVYPDNRR